MRVHKENTLDYEPFYKTMFGVDIAERDAAVPVLSVTNVPASGNMLEKFSHMFQNLTNFNEEIKSLKTAAEISNSLRISIKRLLPVKNVSLMLFDENALKLVPVDQEQNNLPEKMNHYYKEGILNIVFESGKSMIIPDLDSYNERGSKLNYILFPFFENRRKKGILCILSSIVQKDFTDLDKQFIQILLNVALTKMDSISFKNRLTATYEELQTYQAKLSNDFRLAAIGELTEGIVEDISTPLQVIMSHADLIEETEDNKFEIKKIKQQVKKINTSINRLVKFSTLNQKNIKIQPCNLNNVVNDYYNIVKTTLDNIKMELVLDFEENLPSILSHPNYIFQILTNVIGLIKNNNKGNGGIIIQTRFKNESVLLKLVSTANLYQYSQNSDEKPSELNIRIIENLMKKHEGFMQIDTYHGNGSSVTLQFPLRRKIRV